MFTTIAGSYVLLAGGAARYGRLSAPVAAEEAFAAFDILGGTPEDVG